jgi:hypothetical protein
MVKVFCLKSGKAEWANESGKKEGQFRCTKCGELNHSKA